MATKRTQFRLSIVGNTEDVPRLIRGYGRLISGEVAVVLRPRERKALLVRLATPDEALVWEGDGSADYLHVPGRVLPAAEAVKLGVSVNAVDIALVQAELRRQDVLLAT